MATIQFQKVHPLAQIPAYQTPGSSGFDFVAVEDVTIRPGLPALVPTGLVAEIPPGFEIQIRARSGLALKFGLFLVNGIGTIDSDYRGEIKIIMSTCKEAPYIIRAGERIAQGVLAKVEQAKIAEAKSVSRSERAEGGFGSTGLRANS